MSKKAFGLGVAITAIIGMADGHEQWAIAAICVIAVSHSIIQGLLDRKKNDQ